jgi:hypothetical protein
VGNITLRQATAFLLVLAAVVVGVTTWELLRHGPLDAVMFLPAGLMLAILAAWPFLNGWKPWVGSMQQLQDCSRCGTQWRPADEEGATRCPACAETA